MKRKKKLLREGWTLDRLVARVCEIEKVDPDDLSKKGRERKVIFHVRKD